MEFPKLFFKRVFRNSLLSHHLDVEVRCLHQARDKESLWPKHFWCRSLKQLEGRWPEIERLNSYGYDIHFTVVPRLREFRGKHEHSLPEMPIISCLWTDLDVGKDKPFRNLAEARQRVLEAKPAPGILVESGSGLHVYYMLKGPRKVSRERLDRVLRNLANLLDGDPGAARATRLMRVPNTYNWKMANDKRLARAHYMSKKRYRLKTLEGFWAVNEREQEQNELRDGPRAKYREFFASHLRQFVVSKNGTEATALCPFHEEHRPSFSVNLSTGLWNCHSSRCRAKGNVSHFCRKLRITVPEAAEIRRFPRLRLLPSKDEWANERVFEKVHSFITSQISFPHAWQAVVVTLWAMGTYLYRQFPCYGHLWLNSPTTHSGKTKLLMVLSTVCFKATAPQLEPTSAVLFRFPSAIGGTLLLDEVDNLDPQKRSEVIAILNSYYKQDEVMRNVSGKKKDFTLTKFPTYCPKVVAGINNLPTTLQDRCIKIFLHRKKASEKVERFMPGTFEKKKHLRNQLEAWSIREAGPITWAYRHRDALGVPDDIDDRAKDILEPLFAVASVLPKWVFTNLAEGTKRIAMERNSEEEESNPVVLGIRILVEHFPDRKETWKLRTETALKLFSREISSVETKFAAQALLRRLGFHSRRCRVDSRVLRAYLIPRKRIEKLSARYGLSKHVV